MCATLSCSFRFTWGLVPLYPFHPQVILIVWDQCRSCFLPVFVYLWFGVKSLGSGWEHRIWLPWESSGTFFSPTKHLARGLAKRNESSKYINCLELKGHFIFWPFTSHNTADCTNGTLGGTCDLFESPKTGFGLDSQSVPPPLTVPSRALWVSGLPGVWSRLDVCVRVCMYCERWAYVPQRARQG